MEGCLAKDSLLGQIIECFLAQFSYQKDRDDIQLPTTFSFGGD